MKNKIFIIGMLAMSSVVFTGCKKELDLLPTDSIVEANAFQSVADLQRGLNTVYARYNNYENTMFLGSVASDEAKFGRDNGGQGQFVFRYQYNADPTTGGDAAAGWGGFYSMLEFCNRTLGKIDEVPAANSAEQAQKPIIRSQLLVLRAAAHFELLIRFSRGQYNPSDLCVPVRTSSGELFITPARNTSGEVMAQIEADIASALALMPAVTPANFNDVTFNRINTTALLARIALWKREWQRAADFANTVITSSVRPLASTAAAFTGIWDDSNLSSEVLFRIKRNSPGIGNTWLTTGNLIHFSPTDKLRAAYDATNDIRFATYIGQSGTAWFIRKYLGSVLGGRINDVKVLRISEMHLIRAEALAELSAAAGDANFTAAAAELNLLRSRRITGYVNQNFTSRQELIDAVLNERFRELCFEGFRFWDHKRRALPITRLASDVDGTNWLTLPADNFRFAMPIPVGEIQANPNMVQNPGY